MRRGGFDNRSFGGGGFADGFGGRPSPIIIGLMLGVSIAFLLQGLFKFGLFFVPANFLTLRAFTIITGTLTHLDVLPWLFGVLMLYSFGGQAEAMLGSRRFLQLYFLGGIFINLVLGGLGWIGIRYGGLKGFSISNTHLYGSAFAPLGLMIGIVAARTWKLPQNLNGIPMTGKTMFFVFLALFFIFLVYGSGDSFGSMLGLGFGYLYVNGFSPKIPGVAWAREKLRLWRVKRKYKNFKVVESEMNELWDDLEDRMNQRDRNERIH